MKRPVVLISIIMILLALFSCGKNPQEKRADYLMSADKYAAQNKYAEAAIQYQNALKIAPDDATTLIKLGEIQLIQQRPGDAYNSLLKAVKLDPKNINAHSNLATIYLLAKRYDDATKEADIILEMDPKNLHGKEVLAQSLFLSGKSDEALKMLREMIANKEASESMFVDAIQILFESARYEDALGLVIDGLTEFPSSSGIRIAASQIYSAKKQPDMALKMAEDAYAVSRGDINAGMFLAAYAANNGMPGRFASVMAEMKKRYPDDYRVYLLESDDARKKKDIDFAIVSARKALELNYSEQSAVLLTELYAQKGENGLALDTINKAIVKFPSSVPLKIILARQLLIKGDSVKALQIIDPLVKSMPENPDVAIVASRVYLMRGEQEKARSFIDNVLKYKKDDPKLHAMLATIYFKSADYRKALTEVEVTHKAGYSSEELLNIGVISALNMKKPEKALEFIKQLKKSAPDEWATVYSEITYYLYIGEIRPAFRLAEKAVQIWPDKMEALTVYAQTGSETIGPAATIQGISSICAKGRSSNCMLVLSVLYEKAGMRDDALAKIKGAIAQDPGREDLYYALGDFYTRNGMTEQAITEFKNLLNKKPNDMKSAVMLAVLLHDKGDIGNAEKTYSYILDRDPSNKIAANNLAWILAEHGGKADLDKAMDLALKARRMDPENPTIADTLGFIYMQKGMTSTAKTQFLMALDKNPDDPSFNYHMAQALVKEGKNREAALYLKMSLKTASFGEREAAQKLLKKIGG